MMRGASQRLKRALRRTIRAAGYDVRRYRSTYEGIRSRLLGRLGITVVLDVGANAGQYATRLRHAGYRGRIVSFEPVSTAFRELELRARRDRRWECRRLALGREDGTLDLNVAIGTWASSPLAPLPAYREREPRAGVAARERVPVARLDSVAGEILDPGDRTWLKLDVQGFELAVLGGAEATLERVSAMEIELSLSPLYRDQPLAHEVLDHLVGRGFHLMGLDPLNAGGSDPIAQFDAILVRDATN